MQLFLIGVAVVIVYACQPLLLAVPAVPALLGQGHQPGSATGSGSGLQTLQRHPGRQRLGSKTVHRVVRDTAKYPQRPEGPLTMPQTCPNHCPPERGGVAVLVVLAVVLAAALARPVVHAAEPVLEVAAITAGVVLGLAVAAGVVALAVTARRRAGPGLTCSPSRNSRESAISSSRARRRSSRPAGL